MLDYLSMQASFSACHTIGQVALPNRVSFVLGNGEGGKVMCSRICSPRTVPLEGDCGECSLERIEVCRYRNFNKVRREVTAWTSPEGQGLCCIHSVLFII